MAPANSRSTTLRYHAVGAQKCTATSHTWLRCHSLQSYEGHDHDQQRDESTKPPESLEPPQPQLTTPYGARARE